MSSVGNVLLIGLWPPTNEMLASFSPDNPAGWKGSNYLDSGFDVYSYFPLFPGCVWDPDGSVPFQVSCQNPIGAGRFMIDYRRVLQDFSDVTRRLEPLVIITFSQTPIGNDLPDDNTWEIEALHKNRDRWATLFGILEPAPNPPDSTVPVDHRRFSSLPMQAIEAAVNRLRIGVTARIDHGAAGDYVSEYLGYLGVWYQARHAGQNDPARCVAAGHVHVGERIHLQDAVTALTVTVDATITHVCSLLPHVRVGTYSGDPVSMGRSSVERIGLVARLVERPLRSRAGIKVCTGQSPDPGTKLSPGSTVTLYWAWDNF